jgi:hypothetical protein
MRLPPNEPTDMLKRLQELAIDAEPTHEDREAAFAAITDAVADEQLAVGFRSLVQSGSPSKERTDAAAHLRAAMSVSAGRRRRVRPLTAIAAALILAVGTVSIVWTLRPTPVTALGSIAEATSVLPADEFGDAMVERRTSDKRLVVPVVDDTPIPVLHPVDRIDRIDAQGRIERTETSREPILLNPQDSPFFDTVRAELNPGTTTVVVFDTPVTDEAAILTDSPEDLGVRLRSEYDSWGDPATPFAAFALERITNIYLNTLPTPQQRAAILEFLDSLPELTQVTLPDGAAVHLRYDGLAGSERRDLTFDDTGWLTSSALTLIDGSDIDRIPPSTKAAISLVKPEVSS